MTRNMRSLVFLCLLVSICCSFIMSVANAAAPLAAADGGLASLLVHPVTFRGTLDGAEIQMDLRLKAGESEALEGSYFRFGQTQRTLLAGEFEEDALLMEESANGKDVSGLWDGVFDGTTLRGSWSSPDGADIHSFVLKVMSFK